jgi:hypothetical protein
MMYNREIFWKLVEVGLAKASVTAAQAIKAFARIYRIEIDLFIGGFEPTDRNKLARLATDYVAWVEGTGPQPGWTIPFLVNYPD